MDEIEMDEVEETEEVTPDRDVTYPNVTVELLGHDGNAFAIMGNVRRAIRRGVGAEAADKFMERAMASESYDDLLRYVMETVVVE